MICIQIFKKIACKDNYTSIKKNCSLLIMYLLVFKFMVISKYAYKLFVTSFTFYLCKEIYI
jgi:hypothetical protein